MPPQQGGGGEEIFLKVDIKIDIKKLETTKEIVESLKKTFASLAPTIRESTTAFRELGDSLYAFTKSLKEGEKGLKDFLTSLKTDKAVIEQAFGPLREIIREVEDMSKHWNILRSAISMTIRSMSRLADTALKKFSSLTKIIKELNKALLTIHKTFKTVKSVTLYKEMAEGFEHLVNKINKMAKRGKFDHIFKVLSKYKEPLNELGEVIIRVGDAFTSFTRKVGALHSLILRLVEIVAELRHELIGLRGILTALSLDRALLPETTKRKRMIRDFWEDIKRAFGLRGAKGSVAGDPLIGLISLGASVKDKLVSVGQLLRFGFRVLDASVSEGLLVAREVAERAQHLGMFERALNVLIGFGKGFGRVAFANAPTAATALAAFPLWGLKTGALALAKGAFWAGRKGITGGLLVFEAMAKFVASKSAEISDYLIFGGKTLAKAIAFLAMPSLGFAVGVSKIMKLFGGIMIPILAVSELLENLSQLVFILQQPQFMLQFAMEDIIAKMRNVLYGIPNVLMNLADMLAEAFSVGIADMRSEIKSEYVKVGSVAVAFYNLKTRMKAWYDSLSSIEKETTRLYTAFDEINRIFGIEMAKELVKAMKEIGYKGKDPAELLSGTVKSMAKVLAHLTVLVFTVVDALSPLFEVLNKVIGRFGLLVSTLIKATQIGNAEIFYQELDKTFSEIEKNMPNVLKETLKRIGRVLDIFLKISADVLKNALDPKKRKEAIKHFEKIASQVGFAIATILADIGRIIVRLLYAALLVAGDAFLQALGYLGKAISDLFSGVSQGVANAFKSITDTITDFWNANIAPIVSGALQTLANLGKTIGNFILTFIEYSVKPLTFVLSAIKTFLSGVSSVFEALGLKGIAEWIKKAEQAVDGINKSLSNARETLTNAFAGLGKWATDTVTNIGKTIGEGAKKAGEAVTGSLKTLQGNITKTFAKGLNALSVSLTGLTKYMLFDTTSVTGLASKYGFPEAKASETKKVLAEGFVSKETFSELVESLKEGKIEQIFPYLKEVAKKDDMLKKYVEYLALLPSKVREKLIKGLSEYLVNELKKAHGGKLPESVSESEIERIVEKWLKSENIVKVLKAYGEKVAKIAWLYARDVSGALISWQDALNRVGEIELNLPDVGKIRAPVRAINSFMQFLSETNRAISNFVSAFTKGNAISMSINALKALTSLHVLIDTYKKLEKEAKEKGFSMGVFKYLDIETLKKLAKELPQKFGETLKEATLTIFEEMKRQFEILSAFTDEETKALKLWTIANMRTPRTIAGITKFLMTVATKGDKEFRVFADIALNLLKRFASTVAGSFDTAKDIIMEELAEASYIIDELQKGIYGMYVNIRGKITTLGDVITNLRAPFGETGLTYGDIIGEIDSLNRFANLFTRYGNPLTAAASILASVGNTLKTLYNMAKSSLNIPGLSTEMSKPLAENVTSLTTSYYIYPITIEQAKQQAAKTITDTISGGLYSYIDEIDETLGNLTKDVHKRLMLVLPTMKTRIIKLANLLQNNYTQFLNFFTVQTYNAIKRSIDYNIDLLEAVKKGFTDLSTRAGDVVANIWDFDAFKNVTITLKGNIRKLSDLQQAIGNFVTALGNLSNVAKDLESSYGVSPIQNLANLLNVYIALFGDEGLKVVQGMADKMYDKIKNVTKVAVENTFKAYSKVWDVMLDNWLKITLWETDQAEQINSYITNVKDASEGIRFGLYQMVNGVVVTMDEYEKLMDEWAVTIKVANKKVTTTLKNLSNAMNKTKSSINKLLGLKTPRGLSDVLDLLFTPLTEIAKKTPGALEKLKDKFKGVFKGKATGDEIVKMLAKSDISVLGIFKDTSDSMTSILITKILALRQAIGDKLKSKIEEAYGELIDYISDIIVDAFTTEKNYKIVSGKIVTIGTYVSEVVKDKLKDVTGDIRSATSILSTSFGSFSDMLQTLTDLSGILAQMGDTKKEDFLNKLKSKAIKTRETLNQTLVNLILMIFGGEEGVFGWLAKYALAMVSVWKQELEKVKRETKILFEAASGTSKDYKLVEGNIVTVGTFFSDVVVSGLKDAVDDIGKSMDILKVSFSDFLGTFQTLITLTGIIAQTEPETAEGKRAKGFIEKVKAKAIETRKKMNKELAKLILETFGGEEGLIGWMDKYVKISLAVWKQKLTKVKNETEILYEAMNRTTSIYELINGAIVTWADIVRGSVDITVRVYDNIVKLSDLFNSINATISSFKPTTDVLSGLGGLAKKWLTLLSIGKIGGEKGKEEARNYSEILYTTQKEMQKRVIEFFKRPLRGGIFIKKGKATKRITLGEAATLSYVVAAREALERELAANFTMIFITTAIGVLKKTALQLASLPITYYEGQITNIASILSGTLSKLTVSVMGEAITVNVKDIVSSITSMYDALGRLRRLGSVRTSFAEKIRTVAMIYSFADYLASTGIKEAEKIKEKAKSVLIKSQGELLRMLWEAIKGVGDAMDKLSVALQEKIDSLRSVASEIESTYQEAKSIIPNFGALFSLNLVGFVSSVANAGASMLALGGKLKGAKVFGVDIGGLFTGAGLAISGVVNVLGLATGGVGTAILAVLQVLFDVLKPVLEPLINMFIAGFLQPLMSSKHVTNAIAGIMNAFQGLLNFAFQLGQVLGQIITPIIENLIIIFSAIADVLTPPLVLLANTILFVGRVIAWVVNAIITVTRPILEFIAGLIHFVAGILGGFVGVISGLMGLGGENSGGDVINVNVNITGGESNPFIVDDIVYAIAKAKYKY